MKNITLLCILILAISTAGCYQTSSQNAKAPRERKADPVIAQKQREKALLSAQTLDEMRASGKVPSVDFEFDSVNLAPSAYPILDNVAEIMRSNQHLKLIIEGHTDVIGSDEYNDWLSKARAMAIKSYIVSRGVYPDSITVYGYGNKRPLTLDTTPAGRAVNRRVEFTFTRRDWKSVY